MVSPYSDAAQAPVVEIGHCLGKVIALKVCSSIGDSCSLTVQFCTVHSSQFSSCWQLHPIVCIGYSAEWASATPVLCTVYTYIYVYIRIYIYVIILPIVHIRKLCMTFIALSQCIWWYVHTLGTFSFQVANNPIVPSEAQGVVIYVDLNILYSCVASVGFVCRFCLDCWRQCHRTHISTDSLPLQKFEHAGSECGALVVPSTYVFATTLVG